MLSIGNPSPITWLYLSFVFIFCTHLKVLRSAGAKAHTFSFVFVPRAPSSFRGDMHASVSPYKLSFQFWEVRRQAKHSHQNCGLGQLLLAPSTDAVVAQQNCTPKIAVILHFSWTLLNTTIGVILLCNFCESIADAKQHHSDVSYENKFEQSAAATFVYFVTSSSSLLTECVYTSVHLVPHSRYAMKGQTSILWCICNAFPCLLRTLKLKIYLRTYWMTVSCTTFSANSCWLLAGFRIRWELISHTVGLI